MHIKISNSTPLSSFIFLHTNMIQGHVAINLISLHATRIHCTAVRLLFAVCPFFLFLFISLLNYMNNREGLFDLVYLCHFRCHYFLSRPCRCPCLCLLQRPSPSLCVHCVPENDGDGQVYREGRGHNSQKKVRVCDLIFGRRRECKKSKMRGKCRKKRKKVKKKNPCKDTKKKKE